MGAWPYVPAGHGREAQVAPAYSHAAPQVPLVQLQVPTAKHTPRPLQTSPPVAGRGHGGRGPSGAMAARPPPLGDLSPDKLASAGTLKVQAETSLDPAGP